MLRKCVSVVSSGKGDVEIYVDTTNKDEIMTYLTQDERHKKKAKYIFDLILNRISNTEVYDKEDISEQASDITAMKFFKGGENMRIYCKEYRSGTALRIVMCFLYAKKSEKNDKKTRNIIDKVSKYDHEI